MGSNHCRLLGLRPTVLNLASALATGPYQPHFNLGLALKLKDDLKNPRHPPMIDVCRCECC